MRVARVIGVPSERSDFLALPLYLDENHLRCTSSNKTLLFRSGSTPLRLL
jgi:hypothetical protein